MPAWEANFEIETHNLSGFVSSVLDLSSLWSQIGTFLNLLEQALKGKVFGVSLPIIGNKLKDGADLIDKIRTAISGGTGSTEDAIQQTLFNLLGPAALNVLNIDPNFDGDPALTYHDIPVDFSVPNQVLIDLKINKTGYQSSVPIDFNAGIPGLGLTVTPGSTVNVSMNWDAELELGVSKQLGFFFDANHSHLNVDVAASLSPTFQAIGTLGFLQLNLVNHPNPAPGENTQLGLDFAVNLQDPTGGDGKVTYSELTSPGFDFTGLVSATASGSAVINLDATASFGGNAAFPSVGTNIFFQWMLPTFSTTASTADMGDEPTLEFRNTYLDAGSFIGNFLKPYVKDITDALAPIQPILNVLEAPLPIFSDLGPLTSLLDTDHDGKVTLIELYEAYTGFNGATSGDGVPDNSAFKFLKQIDTIDKIATKIESFTGGSGLQVPIGSFTVGGGTDIRSLSNLQNVVPQVLGQAQDFINNLENIGSQAADQVADILNSFSTGDPSDDGTASGGESGGFSGGDATIAFPIYQNPASVIQLLFGKDIDLVTLAFTPFKFNAGFDDFIPILGPLGIDLAGNFQAIIRASFGYDTHGLRTLINDPTHNPADLLDGFYMVDDDKPGEVDEVYVNASIRAAAAADIVVASVSVGGGIIGTVEGDLNDPNEDGRVHLDEVADADCLINIHGYVDAFLDAEAKVDLLFYSHTWTYDIAQTRLLDFLYTCGPSPFDPVLGEVNNGVLTLNMGPNAGLRANATNMFADTNGNEDEAFHVSQKRDSLGNIVAGTLTVSWMDFTPRFYRCHEHRGRRRRRERFDHRRSGRERTRHAERRQRRRHAASRYGGIDFVWRRWQRCRSRRERYLDRRRRGRSDFWRRRRRQDLWRRRERYHLRRRRERHDRRPSRRRHDSRRRWQRYADRRRRQRQAVWRQ